MTDSAPPSSYRFGHFELQPGERRLLAAGVPAVVESRAFDVLVALVERAGHLVMKQELLDLVWPNLVVEENNLQVQVSALRKILGPATIATVPGRGYRFMLEPTREVVAQPPLAVASKNNLPQQVTLFVGREREMAEVKQLLANTRLLTLIGVGGIGKTRLTLRVAAAMMDEYPHGVWFVELAPLADARLVPQAVASVLGVKEKAGRPVIESLLWHVKDRQVLLILDNCEHLIHACAELAKELLQSGPHLKVLATSREHLHVAGETSYLVLGLATPDPQKANSLAALTQYEAVRLFIDRAVAAKPDFQLTHQNAIVVADICQRLDGIPLAIELAAARVRALSVAKIDARLSDRFRLLAGGDQTALPRQQTLRASIDWSYDLLPEAERAVLCRFVVFAGSWTLEAAEAVGAGGEVAEQDVLDLLIHLVEKSLVVLEADGERYRLLETVRQYAQEKLHESGEEDAARTRHLAFYLAFAEKAEPELFGPAQAAYLARLVLEQENLLAAHSWCDRAERGGEMGLRLVRSLRRYWQHYGLLGLEHRVALDALTRAGAQERSLPRSQALYAAAYNAINMGRNEEAEEYGVESLAIAREIGDNASAAEALRVLGSAFLYRGDPATAWRHAQESVALARELGNKGRLGHALSCLALQHSFKGDRDAAEPILEEALTLLREVGDRGLIAHTLAFLATVSIGRGSTDRARVLLVEGLAICEEISSRRVGGYTIERSALLAALLGESERAAQLHGAVLALREQWGFGHSPEDEALLVPLIAKAREALGEAAFAAAETGGRALGFEEASAEARAWLENRPRTVLNIRTHHAAGRSQ